jgi:hypothetical protein
METIHIHLEVLRKTEFHLGVQAIGIDDRVGQCTQHSLVLEVGANILPKNNLLRTVKVELCYEVGDNRDAISCG